MKSHIQLTETKAKIRDRPIEVVVERQHELSRGACFLYMFTSLEFSEAFSNERKEMGMMFICAHCGSLWKHNIICGSWQWYRPKSVRRGAVL